MTYETNQWTELSPPQARFFRGQLAAVTETAFSTTAQDAGIVPIHASRHSFETNELAIKQEHRAILWPDPSYPNSECVVTSSNRLSAPVSTFVRVTETRHSYIVEGVGLGLRTGAFAHMHGYQLAHRSIMEDMTALQLCANFLVHARAVTTSRGADALANQQPAQNFRLIGIESGSVAELFRSLSSLGANLVINGSAHEQSALSTSTYELARALLNLVLADSYAGRTTKGDTYISGNGATQGVLHEAEDGTVTGIYRRNMYPDTIALATATKSGLSGDTLFVDQYSIQARGVTLNAVALPVTEHDPSAIIHALSLMEINPKREDADIRAELDETGRRALEARLIALMAERNAQTSH